MLGRYLQIQATVTHKKRYVLDGDTETSTTHQIPTFYLDRDVLGIPMKDKWEPLYPDILRGIVENILNPCKFEGVEIFFTPMVAHCEFQPVE